MRLLLACLVFLLTAACSNDETRIELVVDADVSHAVTVDLVVIEDNQLAQQLLSTQAPDWFANKSAYMMMGGVKVSSYQLVPLSSVSDAVFPPLKSATDKRLIVVSGSDGSVVFEADDGLVQVVVGAETISTRETSCLDNAS